MEKVHFYTNSHRVDSLTNRTMFGPKYKAHIYKQLDTEHYALEITEKDTHKIIYSNGCLKADTVLKKLNFYNINYQIQP